MSLIKEFTFTVIEDDSLNKLKKIFESAQEKINNSILKKLYLDIDKIKKGNYLVETQLIDIEENDKEASNTTTSNNINNN
jgi:hypothetical protein